MTTLSALFVSPFTWMIFGGAAQLSLAAYVRAPRDYLWALPPGVAAVCLVAAVPTSYAGTAEAYQIAMAWGLFMAACMVAAGAPAAMNEGLILAITTTYWICFLTAGPRDVWGSFSLVPAAFVAATPTFLVVAIALTGHRPGRWLRFVLYLWALFALVVVGLMRFPRADLASLQSSGRTWVMILAATYLGAHLAMLVHNAGALILLLPFFRSGQDYARRWKEIQKYAGQLIDNYSPEPLGWRKAALVVAAQAAFVGLLSLWRPAGAGIAAHSCLSLCLVASIFFSRRIDPEPRLPTGGDIKRALRRRRASGGG